ncbi:hypothetical protein NC652_009713 [Populus alba x Populus x berolinensis]|nr:hypothetical protein NC652_009713 [Populus alba x Populus x berolinensis]
MLNRYLVSKLGSMLEKVPVDCSSQEVPPC